MICISFFKLTVGEVTNLFQTNYEEQGHKNNSYNF